MHCEVFVFGPRSVNIMSGRFASDIAFNALYLQPSLSLGMFQIDIALWTRAHVGRKVFNY